MRNLTKLVIAIGFLSISRLAFAQEIGQFDQSSNEPVFSQNSEAQNFFDNRNPDARIRWYSAGEVRTNKLINTEFTFRPRLNERIDQLRIVSTRGNGVDIQSVIVEFRNGQEVRVRRLERRLRKGDRITANIGYRFVKEVRIVAVSDSLVGSRGRFRLDLGIFQD